MNRLILILSILIFSCTNKTDFKPQVIAYYAGDEKSIDEFNFNSKGYKEATKLVNDLRRGLFRKLNDDELETFMDVLANSFDLKKKYN